MKRNNVLLYPLTAIMLITGLPTLAMDAELQQAMPGAEANNDYAFFLTAYEGNEPEVRRLIELKANVNFADDLGFTPLIAAAQSGHLEVVKTLLQHKANMDAQAAGANSSFALFNAAMRGHDQIVRLLLDQHADINMTDAEKVTPLIVAAQNGHLKAADVLLDHGADVNTQSISANLTFPLLSAAAMGHEKIVRLLLDKGAEVDKIDAKGMTPLIIAAAQGHVDAVKILIKHGANVNAQAAGLQNIFALYMAAAKGHIEVVKALLTTISDTDAQPMRDSCFALHRSIGRCGVNASKDMRRLVADRFINAIVQKHMKKVVWPMIALQTAVTESAWHIAFERNHQDVADLLDLNFNLQSQEIIRKMLRESVWQAVRLHPSMK